MAWRTVTYDPDRRPEVSNLVMLAALCLDQPPEQVAESVGAGGAGALKATLTDAINDRLRPIRTHRRELAADPGYLRDVLAVGNKRARDLADTTLRAVQELMHTTY